MDRATAELLLMVIRLGREAIRQLGLADLETLPPEVKQALLDERDALLTEWDSLAPQPPA